MRRAAAENRSMPSFASRVRSFVAALLLALAPGLAAALPAFTPNVVDPDHLLDAAGTAAVNAELQRIRASGILGALYIVDTLDGVPIETVANEAFEKWELGKKGVDNGLLLVLALRDRKSRFEVGYGLEGSIPDLVAAHALQHHLAPRMREGDVAGAVVASFAFLARVVAKDPDAVREAEAANEDEFVWKRGLVAWGVMTAVVWLSMPIRNAWLRRRRQRLERIEPGLLRDGGGLFGGSGQSSAVAKTPFLLGVGLKAFLTINPGVFVLIGASLALSATYGLIALSLLVGVLVVGVPLRRFASPAAYRRFLEQRDRQRAAMIAKGHLVERSTGRFEYTQAYHDSVRAAASSGSGSSSSSSSSSSSGGGRSGGGGASGSW
jgi:uncharacterized protein